MPIYEYECEKCGVTFEAMQTISAKPLKTCMGLGCDGKDKGKVHRLVSASGFILKGSGWYATDYPSESRKKGWEEESKTAKPEPTGPACSQPGCEKPAMPPENAKPKPAAKKKPTAAKNPYTKKKKASSKPTA